MRPMPTFILTTCGTSLLTNGADDATRKVAGRCANLGDADISSEDRDHLTGVAAERRGRLRAGGLANAAKMSAEIHGLVSYYGGQFPLEARRRDVHVFLASDTYVGRLTRDLAMEWLGEQGFEQVMPLDVSGIRTSSLADFRLGTSELLERVDALVRSQREARHACRFNLSGGFKSVNAFLQLLGALWADEVFFVFEGSRELIRIPRLPLTLDVEGAVREHLGLIRRLVALGSVPMGEGRALPDGFYFESDGKIALSQWIEALYQPLRPRLYEETLWPSWSDRVVFGPAFRGSTDGLPPDRLRRLNERIDDLCRHTFEPERPLQRLDLKPIRGPAIQGSTHEADAWADGSAKRLFLHREGASWVIDRLGTALH